MKMRSQLTKISKSRLALTQLRSSIQLFNKGDYISALTLAGAANEILGELALHKQGYNSTDGDKAFWDSFAQIIKKNKPSRGKIIQINNRIKNVLKHHDSANDSELEADFEFEAQCHIDSAIRNYWIAFDKSPKDRIITNYTNLQWT